MPCSRFAVLLSSLLVLPAAAQTDFALMTKPWPTGTPVDAVGTALFLPTESEGVGGDDVDLSILRVAGRVRPDTDAGHRLTLGYELSHLDLNTDDALLPERLHSSAVAVGGKFGTFDAFEQSWEWGGSVGVGHASSNPFGDGDAWYLLGSVFATTRLSQTESLIVGVDFDGNRVVFPDLPLPALTYQNRYSEQLTFLLGFPVNSIIWTPDDRWTLRAGVAGIAFNARASYAISDQLSVFAAYGGDGEGFHVADDDSDRRLFYSAQTVEAGVEFGVTDRTALVLAGGFAFDQEFERGFDLRDTDTVRELDDAGYVRFGGRFSF